MSARRHINRWFDQLVGEGYTRDQEQLYRARILAGILSIYISLMILTSMYMLFIAPVLRLSAVLASVLQLFMAGSYGYVLYLLRFGQAYQRCVDLTVLTTLVGVLLGIGVSGGPLVSPATPLMVVPVLIAFSLGTRQKGLKWSFFVMLSHMFMIMCGLWWIQFPQFLDPLQMTSQHVVHWVVTYFAIIFLMMIFQSIMYRLKQERDAERDRFAYMAAHDPLTGLANRILFDEQLTRALASCERNKNIVGLMVIDLDGFKPVNDRFGHAAGDLVLKAIALRLTELLRKTDTVARIGGDEFAVIVENVLTPPGVQIVAERIIAEINKPYEGLPAEVRIGASVGIALYPQDTRDEDQLRVFADRAMYVAKLKHNSYRLFSPEMNPDKE